MAYTEQQLADLRSAMAKGVRVFQMGNERVEFRSIAEMERMERRMMEDLGHVSKRRVAQIHTVRGW